MGQYFQIVNIDKRQTTGHLGKWGEFSHDYGVSRWIRANKMRPLNEILKVTDLFTYRGGIDSHNTLGRFDKIPVEVISMIFEALPTVESAIMFAITNTRLFAIGYSIMSQRIFDASSPWVYGRIICIGDYAEDLPSGCLAEDEKRSLLKDLPAADGNQYINKNGTVDLYHIALESFAEMPHCSSTSRATFDDDAYWRLDTADARRYYYLDGARENLCERIQVPVLINTTKKEYIRQAEDIEFKIVIPQLVVWGQQQWEGVDLLGPWAGDRLAVISMDDLASRMKQEGGWKDFTEEGLRYQNEFLKMF